MVAWVCSDMGPWGPIWVKRAPGHSGPLRLGLANPLLTRFSSALSAGVLLLWPG